MILDRVTSIHPPFESSVVHFDTHLLVNEFAKNAGPAPTAWFESRLSDFVEPQLGVSL